MGEQDRRRLAGNGSSRSALAACPEKPTMAAGFTLRRRPTCSDSMVPWLKPTSASRSGGRFEARQFGIEKRVQRRGSRFAHPFCISCGSMREMGNH